MTIGDIYRNNLDRLSPIDRYRYARKDMFKKLEEDRIIEEVIRRIKIEINDNANSPLEELEQRIKRIMNNI